jgi:hypothetical protein
MGTITSQVSNSPSATTRGEHTRRMPRRCAPVMAQIEAGNGTCEARSTSEVDVGRLGDAARISLRHPSSPLEVDLHAPVGVGGRGFPIPVS